MDEHAIVNDIARANYNKRVITFDMQENTVFTRPTYFSSLSRIHGHSLILLFLESCLVLFTQRDLNTFLDANEF